MNALTRSIVTDLKAHIEFHGNCAVCLQVDQCSTTGEFLGYSAFANRYEADLPYLSSHTVATARDESPIACLDKLAAQLGVELEARPALELAVA